MKFEHTQVMNFKNSFRGLRNPLQSWDKSDSYFGLDSFEYCEADFEVAYKWALSSGAEEGTDEFDRILDECDTWLLQNGVLNIDHDVMEYAFIGPKDLDLAHRMIKAGTSDSKFLRQIFVSADITAPLYWWKQADTYKVATVANSTSTMHKLASTPITIDCFETDDFNREWLKSTGVEPITDTWVEDIIDFCEKLRQEYLETKDKRYWKELIRWLPEGWLQTRTWTANYAVLRNIYFQRRHHKLTQWHKFCEWIESLPYAADLITYTGEEKS